jgi:hypothetical protein
MIPSSGQLVVLDLGHVLLGPVSQGDEWGFQGQTEGGELAVNAGRHGRLHAPGTLSRSTGPMPCWR